MMHQEPIISPWGKVDRCKSICDGVYSVSTASHGGIMVALDVADSLLSNEAQECAFTEGSYLCFEEDCDAAVAIRELLDKGIYKAPFNENFKNGKYSELINNSLQRWHPEYWKHHEEQTKPPAKAKKNRDREER